ncbi:GNAT family N-acetyltransferase [Pseudoxanthomonas indica]|uniref:Protein N-acetyltransferase, RimJ/RimL family n=1 Tax=Pseudoxanthomonas indica TaxID=428993 RepID=A0A1T5JS38_9GAMM|nr:GNAT family N-acetyltransferase [Pseudoxanthomonas indica]GGD43982.1 N-acetyltransferase [Pseudoxanthomonas indica]SKC54174.1 Protein N-acetyltransferase, RimJ/RimL family [Pseudoxanthomonas indica]
MVEGKEVRLRGDGFVLRRWKAEDARWLIRHANDAEVAAPLSDRFPHPYRREDAWRFLAGEVVNLDEPVFAIDVDGRACGGIGARLLGGDHQGSAELGYWLGRRLWGRGLMSRVVADFVPWLMQHHDIHRVQAVVLTQNAASARVLEKAGFAQEGILRQSFLKHGRPHDVRMYARVRAEQA